MTDSKNYYIPQNSLLQRESKIQRRSNNLQSNMAQSRKATDNIEKTTPFCCKPWFLIMVSLIFLTILGGFLYLILTNQEDKAK